jgi:hypothetical protein
LKKIRRIFIFIFLAGMIFTVFQYLPILEEEAPSHRVELVKKAKQLDPTDDGDNADDDCDDDAEQDLDYLCAGVYNSFYSFQKSLFNSKNHAYKYQLANIHTPPPKV